MVATPISPADYIEHLWLTGHFWDARYPDVLNVGYEHVENKKLTLDDMVVRLATKSYHESDANLDALVAKHHNGRAPFFDIDIGNAGPATFELATLPRCGMPDYPPPMDADLTRFNEIGGADYKSAIISYGAAAATGSGSWPIPGCDPTRPNREREHSTRVSVDSSLANDAQKSRLIDALNWVTKSGAEIGIHEKHIIDLPRDHEKQIAFKNIPGSTIGYNYFPRPGTCQQIVRGRIDRGWNSSFWGYVNLYIHEWAGHGNKLEHTRGGIMNPSIIIRTEPRWIDDTSFHVMKRYFGGQPIEEIPQPGPDPDPEPRPTPTGPTVVFVGDVPRGAYKLVDITGGDKWPG